MFEWNGFMFVVAESMLLAMETRTILIEIACCHSYTDRATKNAKNHRNNDHVANLIGQKTHTYTFETLRVGNCRSLHSYVEAAQVSQCHKRLSRPDRRDPRLLTLGYESSLSHMKCSCAFLSSLFPVPERLFSTGFRIPDREACSPERRLGV